MHACANILWKDSSRALEAAALLKIQAGDLLELGVVDKVIPEPKNGAQTAPEVAVKAIHQCLKEGIKYYSRIPIKQLLRRRNRKYNNIGQQYLVNG